MDAFSAGRLTREWHAITLLREYRGDARRVEHDGSGRQRVTEATC